MFLHQGVRPFGVSLLVSSFDDKGLRLYQVDPSGSYFSWKALAMEKNVSNAKTFLEKRFEGQISGENIETGKIGGDKQFRVLTPAEIDDYLDKGIDIVFFWLKWSSSLY
ncbi:hypothetical protein OIU76_000286 [Salix suchowensis]|nr:hypothetical protein OIU76_000286 [Salix suchowensis]